MIYAASLMRKKVFRFLNENKVINELSCGYCGFAALYILIKMLAKEYELSISISFGTYLMSTMLTFAVSLLVGFMVSAKNKKQL